MSIVDPDYRNRYRGKGDWFKQLVNKLCYENVTKMVEVTKEDGTTVQEEVTTKRRKFVPEALFDLAAQNGIEEERLQRFRAVIGERTGEGRARMSVGNILRAVARKNGYLEFNGKRYIPDEEFLNKPAREPKQAA